MFTSEQRRRLYNYCIQVVKDANKPTTIEEDQLMLKQPKQKEGEIFQLYPILH